MHGATAYAAYSRLLAALGRDLPPSDAQRLRAAADALALADDDADRRLEHAERTLARLEARGRLAPRDAEALHVALRSIASTPLPL